MFAILHLGEKLAAGVGRERMQTVKKQTPCQHDSLCRFSSSMVRRSPHQTSAEKHHATHSYWLDSHRIVRYSGVRTFMYWEGFCRIKADVVRHEFMYSQDFAEESSFSMDDH